MKKFNPERELYKIKYGKRNKIILGIFLLLVIVSIGSTFALYQVRHSKRIIYTTVDDFSKDIQLAVFVDGVKKEDFPKKEEGKIYTKISCNDDNVTASWNYEKWGLELFSKLPNKCNVYFETRWKDSSGASYPELYQGMIPVRFDQGKIYIANLSKEWYNYDNHNWANAVLIDNTNPTIKDKFYKSDGTLKSGDEVSESDILQMYVWIPRYRYKLWNAEYGTSDPFAIEIEFESNTTGRSISANNGEWLTHPAFLFGDTELNGIWVGKFEPSDPKDRTGMNVNVLDEITILPNVVSTVNKGINVIFKAVRNIEKNNKYNLNYNEIDTHPMKNNEWGAVAYLSNSIYGIYVDQNKCSIAECEVWINNTFNGTSIESGGGTITGCVASAFNASVLLNQNDCKGYEWNTTNGIKASTTGNMYGIYDMNGGTHAYTMGFMKNQTGIVDLERFGFSEENILQKKYFDAYAYSENYSDYNRGHLGDATRETLKKYNDPNGGWNDDQVWMVYGATGIVFNRGARATSESQGGIFSYHVNTGNAGGVLSFLVVLTAQDGED